MTEEILYDTCPSCRQGVVRLQGSLYQCANCELTLKESKRFMVLNAGKYEVIKLGTGSFDVTKQAVQGQSFTPEVLKITLNNIYSDDQLTQLAAGDQSVLRPVTTVLAGIILEQLREECFVEVRGIRRAHGPALTGEHGYQPTAEIPAKDLTWKDEGNLFCTSNRLVMPSNKFTFIRLGRKISVVRAFRNGIAVQLKKEEFATYFIGGLPHEAAVVAAYTIGKLPKPKK
ncbi:hypothetical protein QUF63_04865 [Anaerolineales bacterium HSG25]|nr:hypothetical protein [Anaerolineales bacterium HSG25]